MKLSKIIDEITKLKEKHGDVNVDNIVGYLDDCNVTVWDNYNKMRITTGKTWVIDDVGDEVERDGAVLELLEEER